MNIKINSKLLPKSVGAITIFPFIFHKKEMSEVYQNHENIHLKQQLELLVIPFYIIYVLNYIYNLLFWKSHNSAYRNIIFEREAYKEESNLDYINNRKLFNFLKY